jgi:hypothetical protein
MEIFLMVLSLSLVGVLVSGVLFAAANRDPQPEARAVMPATAAGEERFFMMRPAAPDVRGGTRVAADVLALQIERHVRLEQAAAERFHEYPSAEALHMPTLSPLAG